MAARAGRQPHRARRKVDPTKAAGLHERPDRALSEAEEVLIPEGHRCHEHDLPVDPFGAGASVTPGKELFEAQAAADAPTVRPRPGCRVC